MFSGGIDKQHWVVMGKNFLDKQYSACATTYHAGLYSYNGRQIKLFVSYPTKILTCKRNQFCVKSALYCHKFHLSVISGAFRKAPILCLSIFMETMLYLSSLEIHKFYFYKASLNLRKASIFVSLLVFYDLYFLRKIKILNRTVQKQPSVVVIKNFSFGKFLKKYIRQVHFK